MVSNAMKQSQGMEADSQNGCFPKCGMSPNIGGNSALKEDPLLTLVEVVTVKFPHFFLRGAPKEKTGTWLNRTVFVKKGK